MRDIILLIVVITYMIGFYFVVGKIGDFIDKNCKSNEYDNGIDYKSNKTRS